MVGRPTDFQPEFIKQAEKLCALGATDEEVADFFEVSVRTIYRWKHDHEEFCQALKIGKDAADTRVEMSLYHRAIGYTFDSEKLLTVSQGKDQGSVVERHPIREHVPPDVTAGIFWLKNRKRGEWRDRVEHEHTGNPINVSINLDHD